MGQRLKYLYLTGFLLALAISISWTVSPLTTRAVASSLEPAGEQTDPTPTVNFTAVPIAEQVIFEPQSGHFKAGFVSQNPYPRLAAGHSYKFTVSLNNLGSESWSPAVIHLGTDRPRDRIPGFIREDIVGGKPSGWVKENRVSMLRDTVTGRPVGDVNANGLIDPGEQVTFEFWYGVPATMADGLYREYFNLVADGVTWFNELGIYWDVTVDNRPHARWVDQRPYPPTLLAGESYEFWVRFENTGLIPWFDDGPTPVRLATDRPSDRIPGFVREGPLGTISGWVRENRIVLDRDPLTGFLIGDLNTNNQIDPGEIARFRFWYTVPATMESGTYQEYFRPVMDNRSQGWMEDYGVFWTNVVNNIAPRPTGVTVTPQINRIAISWSPQAEAQSYKVRFRPIGSTVFTVLDYPSSLTTANIDVLGGESYEVGVASVDVQGTSPFTETVVRIESPAEAQARLAAAAAVERRLEEERRPPVAQPQPMPPAAEEPVVTGPPAQEEPVRDWRQFWLTLLFIVGAAGLVTAGYYGYEWWQESRRHPRPKKIPPPRRPEPPQPPSSVRW